MDKSDMFAMIAVLGLLLSSFIGRYSIANALIMLVLSVLLLFLSAVLGEKELKEKKMVKEKRNEN